MNGRALPSCRALTRSGANGDNTALVAATVPNVLGRPIRRRVIDPIVSLVVNSGTQRSSRIRPTISRMPSGGTAFPIAIAHFVLF